MMQDQNNYKVNIIGGLILILITWAATSFFERIDDNKTKEIAQNLSTNEIFVNQVLKELNIKSNDDLRADIEKLKSIKSITLGEVENRDIDIAYQAQSDGFVSGILYGLTTSGGYKHIKGYTSKDANFIDIRGIASITGHEITHWESKRQSTFMMPVRKGEFYKVSLGGNMHKSQFKVTALWTPIL